MGRGALELGIELGPLRWFDKIVDGARWGVRVVGRAGRAARYWGQMQRFWYSIPKNIKDRLPDDWNSLNNRKRKIGFRWFDPNDNGNGVRIDKGNPNHSLPSQREDHVIVRHRGEVIGRDGKPIEGKIEENPDAHIPVDEYVNWEKWYAP